MAIRALCSNIGYQVEGDGISLAWVVLFYGSPLTTPDSTNCTVTLAGTSTKAQARTAIRAAIQAEANRLGYAWNGNVTTPEELFAGL